MAILRLRVMRATPQIQRCQSPKRCQFFRGCRGIILGQKRVFCEFVGKRVSRMRFLQQLQSGCRFGFWCAAAGHLFDQRKGQRMQLRAIAGELKLVGRVAKQRMSKQVGLFGLHG